MVEERAVADRQKVAFFLPNLDRGGAERVMASLASGFARRGHHVDFLLASAHGTYLEELDESVRVVDLGTGAVSAAVPKLVGYLRRERPKAALASLPHASVMLVLAKLIAQVDTRVFVREATTRSAAARRGRLSLKQRLTNPAARLFYPFADGIIAVSQGVADDLRDSLSVPTRKIHTVYNPVVSDELLEKSREPLDDPWFDGEVPVVLSVGGLRPEKDFQTLIRAFSRVRARRPARLLILGEGDERARLENLVLECGLQEDVRMPGFDANPFRYMSRASLYVLSSTSEGLPGALIQAMACGSPVVSTDCPSGPAEVLVGGRYGTLVPVRDPERLAGAIVQALERPADREALRRRAADFSGEDSLCRYLELLLGERPEASVTLAASKGAAGPGRTA